MLHVAVAGRGLQRGLSREPLVEVAADGEVLVRPQVGAAGDRLHGVGQCGVCLRLGGKRAKLLLTPPAVSGAWGVVPPPPGAVPLPAELRAAGAVLAAVLVAAAAPLE